MASFEAMIDFFLRDGDEQKCANAQHMDDLDLVPSKEMSGPWGPALVAVAQRNGVHVCWYCGELFDGDHPRLRPVEVQAGYARIMLHAQCINPRVKSVRSFEDLKRGLQARRFVSKAVKAVGSILSGHEKSNESG